MLSLSNLVKNKYLKFIEAVNDLMQQLNPNLNPIQARYLVINPAGVLDPIVSTRISEDDLVLREIDEGIFSILKDGKQVVKHLDKLTIELGYATVLYSNRKERQISSALQELDETCERGGLGGFPKITAIIVKDHDIYPQVRASDLRVDEEYRSHGALMAGYGLQPQQNTDILHGLLQLPHFSQLDLNSCLVLDNSHDFIKKAKQEGWNARRASSISLKEILCEFCKTAEDLIKQQKQASGIGDVKIDSAPNEEAIDKNLQCSVNPNEQNFVQEDEIIVNEGSMELLHINCVQPFEKHKKSKQESDYDYDEIATRELLKGNGVVNIITLTGNDESIEKKHDELNTLQMQSFEVVNLESKEEMREKAELKENNFTAKLLPLSEDLEKVSSTQPFSQIEQEETKQEVAQAANQEDSLPQNFLMSDIKFELLHKPSPGGSSFTRWFTDKESKSEWIGKCSVQAVLYLDEYGEYKEYLASQLYELLGVKVPKTILSKQYVDEKIQEDEYWGNCRGINQPKLHVFSQVVPGFELLGKTFVEDYKNSSKKNRKELFCIGGGKAPLRGFGRVMAVAILTQDYDVIGNSGRNIGYIPAENGNYFEILKIDPGEALTLEQDISGATILQNPPKNREAVVGTQGERINFNELNEIDQKEFVQTLKEILEVKPSKVEEIFSPFFEVNKNFRRAFEEFLNRRQQFLAAFVDETRHLLNCHVKKLQRQEADKYAIGWSQPYRKPSRELEHTAELLRNKAQLEAYSVAEDSNSKNSKQFQISQKREVFVGRESELSQLKKLFIGNNGILGCAIVGGAGLGKSQLATEYIIRNQKEMYSETVWLHAEQSDLIVDQIQIYLETCHKVKIDPKEKDKKAIIIQSFYRIIGKENDETNTNRKPKKACIIFDNADSMAQIADYLPDKRRFPKLQIDIIITSRYKKWEKPIDLIIEMQAFGIEDVKNYISACILNIATNQNAHQLVKDLNDLVGGLPLALSLAVAYIQQKGMSISEFCDIVSKENNREIVTLRSEQISNEDEEKQLDFISTVLTLVLTDLKRKSYSVVSILDMIAYLSPDNISMSLLEDWWIQSQKKNSGGNHSFKKEEFAKTLEFLLSYSIVTVNYFQDQSQSEEIKFINDISSIKMNVNRLTQQVIRINHKKSGDYEKIFENVLDWIVGGLNYNDRDMQDVRRANLFVPHGIHLESLHKASINKKMIQLLERIGFHQLYGMGQYDLALKCYEKVLYFKENCYDNIHPEIGTTLNDLGNAWGSLGKYTRQKDLLIRALEINEKCSGKYHPVTGTTLKNIGDAWGSLGDYQKQKDFLMRALEIYNRHYEENHVQIGLILNNIGIALGKLGDYEEQIDVLRQSLAIKEIHYDKNHPQIGFTLNNLGNAWGQLGEFEKQKDLLTRALKILETHYGNAHPQTALTLSNLGNAWGELRDYEKEKDLLLRALTIKEKHYGADHPQVSVTLNKLAIAWGNLGNYSRENYLLIRALKIDEKYYGKNHPTTGKTLGNLGMSWGKLGDYELQEKMLLRALSIFKEFYGEHHSMTKTTQDILEEIRNLLKRTRRSKKESSTESKSNSFKSYSSESQKTKKDSSKSPSSPNINLDNSHSTDSEETIAKSPRYSNLEFDPSRSTLSDRIDLNHGVGLMHGNAQSLIGQSNDENISVGTYNSKSTQIDRKNIMSDAGSKHENDARDRNYEISSLGHPRSTRSGRRELNIGAGLFFGNGHLLSEHRNDDNSSIVNSDSSSLRLSEPVRGNIENYSVHHSASTPSSRDELDSYRLADSR